MFKKLFEWRILIEVVLISSLVETLFTVKLCLISEMNWKA